MALYIHGQRIRSDELSQDFELTNRNVKLARTEINELNEKVSRIGLAMQAIRRDIPQDLSADVGRNAFMFIKAAPGAGCELVGTSVVTERIRTRTALITTDVGGFGDMELLQPSEVWAGLSPNNIGDFEARIDPAYLTEYTEIVVPYIAGDYVTVRLHNSQTFEELTRLKQTTVKRYATPKEFNGRISISSNSEARFLDQYVHALGGVHINDSQWMEEGVCTAERILDFSGVIRIFAAYSYPDKVPLADYTVYLNDVLVNDPTSFEVDSGDTLRVELTIPWNIAVNYVGIEHAFDIIT